MRLSLLEFADDMRHHEQPTKRTTEQSATPDRTDRGKTHQKDLTRGNPAYYGNLARVASGFYVSTGNPAELNAAYWYARYAARIAYEVEL